MDAAIEPDPDGRVVAGGTNEAGVRALAVHAGAHADVTCPVPGSRQVDAALAGPRARRGAELLDQVAIGRERRLLRVVVGEQPTASNRSVPAERLSRRLKYR